MNSGEASSFYPFEIDSTPQQSLSKTHVEVERWGIWPASDILLHWITRETTENYLNCSLSLHLEGDESTWKMFMLQKPRLPFASNRLPWSSHYATCNPSISLSDSLSAHRLYPPSPFLFPSSFPSLFLHSHTRHQKKINKKCNYNTAKPIWEKQASHSVVEGGWNACCHQTSKLQHDKPVLIACSVQQWDHSSAMWADRVIPGNPFVIRTALALAQSFFDPGMQSSAFTDIRKKKLF